MTKGAKIAVGCFSVLLLGGLCTGGAVFYGLYKAKEKVDEVTGGLEKLQEQDRQAREFSERANANAFSRPTDSRLSEDRLLKFLAVRKDVHAVYDRFRDDIESRKDKQPGFEDLGTLARIVAEIRVAQAQAQAREGVSDDEYNFHVEQVYKTAWARGFEAEPGSNRPVSVQVDEQMSKLEQDLEKQLEDPRLPEAVRTAVREQRDTLRKAREAATEAARGLDVPPENVALLKKHQAEVDKYAMAGLTFIGL